MMFAVTAVGFVLFVGLCLGSPAKYEVEEIGRGDSQNIVTLIVEDFYVEMPVWEETCYVRPVEIVSQTEISSGRKLVTTCANTTVALGKEGVPKDVAKICEGKQMYALDQCGDEHGNDETGLKRKRRSCSCNIRLVCPMSSGMLSFSACAEGVIGGCQWKTCCDCSFDWGFDNTMRRRPWTFN